MLPAVPGTSDGRDVPVIGGVEADGLEIMGKTCAGHEDGSDGSVLRRRAAPWAGGDAR